MSFKRRGAAFGKLFEHIFGFSPWPNDDVLNKLIDLNMVRQLIVHHGGGTLGDAYWNQVTTKSLLKTSQYGNLPPIRSIDHLECLYFLKDAFLALVAQARHMKEEMLQRPEWTYVS